MKAKCLTRCQKDRYIIYEEGKVYDIDKEMLETGFFEPVREKKKEE